MEKPECEKCSAMEQYRNKIELWTSTRMRFHTDGFSKNQAYTNVIMSVGYAGYFVLWSSINSRIPDAFMRVSVFAMILSLGAFIFFEIYKMTILAIQGRQFIKMLEYNEGDEMSALARYEVAHARLVMKANRPWPFVLVFTAVMAVFSALVFAYVVVAGQFQVLNS